MAQDHGQGRSHDRWAHLRFSVVGPLLAAPPPPGELKAALTALAATQWLHPITREPTRFAVSTIERWLYLAKHERADPVGVLRRKVRKDLGQPRGIGDPLTRVQIGRAACRERGEISVGAGSLKKKIKKPLGPHDPYG